MQEGTARKGKRNCVKDCRATAKTPECKKARGALVKGFIKAAQALAKNPQCKEMAQKVGAAIKAAGPIITAHHDTLNGDHMVAVFCFWLADIPRIPTRLKLNRQRLLSRKLFGHRNRP